MQKNLPDMRKSTSLLFLCLCCLLGSGAHAQNSPRIDRVIHNGTRALKTGESLNVILYGDPGGQARFEIMGAIRSVPMQEVSSGRYEAHYTIPAGLEIDRGVVIGYLKRGYSESVREATQAVTVKMTSGGQPTPPKTISVEPEDGDSTEELRPEVSIDFPHAVLQHTLRFYVDGIDFTKRAQLSQARNELDWTPHYDLSKGKHTAEVIATDVTGQRVSHKWSFTTGERDRRGRRGRGVVKEMLPEDDSTVNDFRTPIGIKFRRSVENPRLVIDGRDFTDKAQRNDVQIIWTPNYNLSPGQHWAEVTATRKGRQISKRWEFTLGTATQSLESVEFSPASIKVGEQVTVTVKASPGLKPSYDLGSRHRGLALQESSPGIYTARYTAIAGDEGTHNLNARVQLASGSTLTRASASALQITAANDLVVDNLKEGMNVPVNFNVQGSAPSGSQVLVVTEYAKRDFLGALSGQAETQRYSANVGANKRFDIGVHIGVPKGTQFRLTVSIPGSSAQPLVFNLIRQ